MRRWLMKTLIDLLRRALEHPEERAEIMFFFQRMVRHGRGKLTPLKNGYGIFSCGWSTPSACMSRLTSSAGKCRTL